MTGNSHKKLPAVHSPADYEVGYAKPPVAGQFQKGQSGNPNGRPRGAKNKKPALHEERLKDIILSEAYRTITVRDGSRNVTVPMAQAVVRALAVNAAKGQHRAQRLFAEMLSATERQNKALHDEWLNTAMDYKIEWDRELARREHLGIDGPEPIPHPDQIKIDLREGTARVVGPATKEEKAEYDQWIARKADFEEELDFLKTNLKSAKSDKDIAFYEKEIQQTERVLEVITRLVEGE